MFVRPWLVRSHPISDSNLQLTRFWTGMVHGYQDQGEKVEFSGPLLSQSHRVDELLERHERHIRQAVRRSWFQRGK